MFFLNPIHIDMDGVIYHGTHLLPGAKSLIKWLIRNDKDFLFLTNSSDKTPEILQKKLVGLGINNVSSDHFYTSALSTARFLRKQHGESGGR